MSDRFKGAGWFSEIEKHKILIVGAGGIGSWTALALSRCGFQETILMDNDNVDNTNLSGQFFYINQINHYKVEAVNANVNLYCGSRLNALPYKFKHGMKLDKTNIFISAVDNVEGRRDVYKAFLECDKTNKLFIDGRLSAEFFELKVLTELSTSEEHLLYLKSLDLLSTLEQEDCTYKQTTHIAMIIAGYITSTVTNYIHNVKLGQDLFNVKDVTFNAQIL